MKKIAVIDAIERNRRKICRILEKFGYQYDEFSEGCSFFGASPADFFLAFVSHKLDDISEFEFIAKMRQNKGFREIACIIVSPDNSESYLNRALNVGFRNVLCPPFNLRSVVSCVDEAAAEKGIEFDIDTDNRADLISDAEIVDFIKHLLASNISHLQPVYCEDVNVAYTYPEVTEFFAIDSGEEFSILKRLYENNIVSRHLSDKINLCPRSYWHKLNFRETCPNCNSLNISLENVLHHFRCGYVGPISDFHQVGSDAKICPKCGEILRHIGLDYEKPTDTFVCSDCAYVFNEPEVDFECFFCGYVGKADEVIVRSIYSYHLTAKAHSAAEFNALTAFNFGDMIESEQLNCVKREFFEFMLKRKYLESRDYKDPLYLLLVHAEINRQQLDELTNAILKHFGNTSLITIDTEDVLTVLASRIPKDQLREKCSRLAEQIERMLESGGKNNDDYRILTGAFEAGSSDIQSYLSQMTDYFAKNYRKLDKLADYHE